MDRDSRMSVLTRGFKFIKTLADLEQFCNDCRMCGATSETEVDYDFIVAPYVVLEADNEGKLQINFYDGMDF